MIERLRRRFMAITMVSVGSVILAICLGVWIGYGAVTTAGLDETCRAIATNEGVIPPTFEPDRDPEAPWSTRYFTIAVNDRGVAVASDLSHIAMVGPDQLPAYVELVRTQESGSGYMGPFRYLITTVEGNPQVHYGVFVDASREQVSVTDVAAMAFGLGAAAEVVIWLLVRALSKRAVAPAEAAQAAQRRFITDASHELKTPLTTITGAITLATMDVGPNPWLEKAQDQCGSMAELVDDLVGLARADEGADGGTWEIVDLSQVVQEAMEAQGPGAEATDHPFLDGVAPRLTTFGDPQGLGRLISILLKNALTHGSPASPIAVDLTGHSREIHLTVANVAPTYPEDDLPRLFDRFWRPDRSRTRDTGGTGLGLAMAQATVQAHGGTIAAIQRPLSEAPGTVAEDFSDHGGLDWFSMEVVLPRRES